MIISQSENVLTLSGMVKVRASVSLQMTLYPYPSDSITWLAEVMICLPIAVIDIAIGRVKKMDLL
jgi:hypothetical protein